MAWLAAVETVDAAPGHEAHNVIIDIAAPLLESPTDQAIIAEVDRFLRQRNHSPVRTVANTIFPKSLYDWHGAPDFYEAYLKKVYPRIKRPQGDWGRYFERMISFPLQKKSKSVNPLQDIVEKIKSQVRGSRCFKNVYELTIYDPIRDAGPVMNRQCLSFLSFKLTDRIPRKVLLTAVYRNHYYIERLLGNLVGLSWLMKFVAAETGVAVGELTIVSTHAEIDGAASRAEVSAPLGRCRALAEISVDPALLRG